MRNKSSLVSLALGIENAEPAEVILTSDGVKSLPTPEDQPVETSVVLNDAEISDATLDTTTAEGEVSAVVEGIENIHTLIDSMEALQDYVQASIGRGGLHHDSVAVFNKTIGGMMSVVGIPNTQIMGSVESYGGTMDRRTATRVGLEGVSEWATKLATLIKEMLIKLKKTILDLFNKQLKNIAIIDKWSSSLLKDLSAIKNKSEQLTFKLPDHFGVGGFQQLNFQLNNQNDELSSSAVSLTTLSDVVEAIKKLNSDWSVKMPDEDLVDSSALLIGGHTVNRKDGMVTFDLTESPKNDLGTLTVTQATAILEKINRNNNVTAKKYKASMEKLAEEFEKGCMILRKKIDSLGDFKVEYQMVVKQNQVQAAKTIMLVKGPRALRTCVHVLNHHVMSSFAILRGIKVGLKGEVKD